MLMDIAQLQAETRSELEYDACVDSRKIVYPGRVQKILSLIAKPHSESIPVTEIPIAAKFGSGDLGRCTWRKGQSIRVGRPEVLVGAGRECEKTRWKPGKPPANDWTCYRTGGGIVELLIEIAGVNLTAEQADQAGPD